MALYDDIIDAEQINLRISPNTFQNPVTTIADGQTVKILEERVEGEYIKTLANIWHKVAYTTVSGYVLSSFIDLEGKGRSEIINKITAQAPNFNVDGTVVLNLARCESRYKPYARSYVAAKGVFQLMPATVIDINARLGGNITDVYDPDQNIDGGLRYFEWLSNYYSGKEDAIKKAIAAWNWGIANIPLEGSLITEDLPLETQALINCTSGA